MVVSVALAALALRAGLAMRRARRLFAPRSRRMLQAHLRLAKPAVTLVLLGFLLGAVSAVTLRDWSPFSTFHAFGGIVTAALVATTGWLGRRLERGRGRPWGAHALLGVLSLLAAALTAVAGFVLLP